MDDEAAQSSVQTRGLELFRILTFSTLEKAPGSDRLANFLNASPCALSVGLNAKLHSVSGLGKQ